MLAAYASVYGTWQMQTVINGDYSYANGIHAPTLAVPQPC